jgi:hypothetical protein
LGDVSPVVKTLAQQQFDDYVKRVRIFVHPGIVDELRRGKPSTRALVQTAITQSLDSA